MQSFQCTFVNEKEKATVSIDKNVENVILGEKRDFLLFLIYVFQISLIINDKNE